MIHEEQNPAEGRGRAVGAGRGVVNARRRGRTLSPCSPPALVLAAPPVGTRHALATTCTSHQGTQANPRLVSSLPPSPGASKRPSRRAPHSHRLASPRRAAVGPSCGPFRGIWAGWRSLEPARGEDAAAGPGGSFRGSPPPRLEASSEEDSAGPSRRQCLIGHDGACGAVSQSEVAPDLHSVSGASPGGSEPWSARLA